MNSISYKNRKLYPSKVVCVGRNYTAHIEELKNEVPDQPVVFLKPNSAISRELQADGEEIHYESEISLLIMDAQIAAVGFGLDLTKRALQTKLKDKGLPWERAKAFDGSAVFSEFVALSASIDSLRLELEINGRLIQQGGVKMMLNHPNKLIAEVASFMSFEDGDVLMTGTPSGVGIVTRGDVFCGRIFSNNSLMVEKSWRV